MALLPLLNAAAVGVHVKGSQTAFSVACKMSETHLSHQKEGIKEMFPFRDPSSFALFQGIVLFALSL